MERQETVEYFVKAIVKGDPSRTNIESVGIYGDRTEEDARIIALGIRKRKVEQEGYDHAFVYRAVQI